MHSIQLLMGRLLIGLSLLILTVLRSETNGDGRCMDLLTPRSDSVEDLAILHTGLYKIIFQTKEYFKQTDRDCFYPWVEVRHFRPAFTFFVIKGLLGYIRNSGFKPTLSYTPSSESIFIYNLQR